ncbi:hypothetical protein B0H19DRAFT_1060123 [Mycena capillaripes]|nr:hypothetical protein B0H19DRAFT_1060123 [Mycena capillaripes]
MTESTYGRYGYGPVRESLGGFATTGRIRDGLARIRSTRTRCMIRPIRRAKNTGARVPRCSLAVNNLTIKCQKVGGGPILLNLKCGYVKRDVVGTYVIISGLTTSIASPFKHDLNYSWHKTDAARLSPVFDGRNPSNGCTRPFWLAESQANGTLTGRMVSKTAVDRPFRSTGRTDGSPNSDGDDFSEHSESSDMSELEMTAEDHTHRDIEPIHSSDEPGRQKIKRKKIDNASGQNSEVDSEMDGDNSTIVTRQPVHKRKRLLPDSDLENDGEESRDIVEPLEKGDRSSSRSTLSSDSDPSGQNSKIVLRIPASAIQKQSSVPDLDPAETVVNSLSVSDPSSDGGAAMDVSISKNSNSYVASGDEHMMNDGMLADMLKEQIPALTQFIATQFQSHSRIDVDPSLKYLSSSETISTLPHDATALEESAPSITQSQSLSAPSTPLEMSAVAAGKQKAVDINPLDSSVDATNVDLSVHADTTDADGKPSCISQSSQLEIGHIPTLLEMQYSQSNSILGAFAGLSSASSGDPVEYGCGRDPTGSSSNTISTSTHTTKKSGVTLDDLTMFRVKFDPSLQDVKLVGAYKNLPNLPGGMSVNASWDPFPIEDQIGGRVAFSKWGNIMEDAHPKTIYTAVTFTRSGRHINPSRVSPAMMSIRPTHTTPIMQRFSAQPPRWRKFIALLLHNQDFERWESFIPLNNKPQGQFRPERAKKFKSLTTSYPSTSKSQPKSRLPRQSGPSNIGYPYPVEYSLNYEDSVPTFDAHGIEFDFTADLSNLATKLPKWEDDIPTKAFIVVGYSVATYMSTARDIQGKTIHIGTNLLWIVVCGTPTKTDVDDDDD